MGRLFANSIDPNAVLVHGSVSYNAIDSATRHAVLECTYWKEKLFGINAVGVIDRAISLHSIGTVHGTPLMPTRFMCLLVKLLQLMPPFDVILEMLKQPSFRYLRCLAALFVRMTANAADVYRVLEALIPDYRPIKVRPRDGPIYSSSVDEFVTELLTAEGSWGVCVPLRTLPPRALLVQRGELEQRESLLRGELTAALDATAAAAATMAKDASAAAAAAASDEAAEVEAAAREAMAAAAAGGVVVVDARGCEVATLPRAAPPASE